MAIYHAPEDPNKSTFAGGTMSQAMHKHKLMHGGEESKDSKTTVSEHLEKAEEHIKHARAAHGQMSESKEQDPHEVNEEVGGGGMSEVMSGE